MNKSTSVPSKKTLPTCLFVGPQKAGTSWIHEYLDARGDICLPRGVKETFFFDSRFERKKISWYTSHFRHASLDCRHTIEVAPTYFQSMPAPERIKTTLGIVPIIVTLRHPVSRSFSLYLHMCRYGLTNLPLRDAVEEHPIITDSSNYYKHLLRWHAVFGKENVHVLLQEDLAENAKHFVGKLNEILGVSLDGVSFDFEKRVNEAAVPRSGRLAGLVWKSSQFFRDYRVNWPINLAKRIGLKQFVFGSPSRSELPKLSDEDRVWIADQVCRDIQPLEDMLGRDLKGWHS